MAGGLIGALSGGWEAGGNIGRDISAGRFARKEAELRAEYEQLAAEQGKQLEDYLPQYQADLRKLANEVHATSRGVTDKSGAALDMGAMGRINADVLRGGRQRAGALNLEGKHDEAADTLARVGYKIGDDPEAALAYQRQGDRIRDTRSAITPANAATGAPEQYDMAKGAQAQALSGARYGDPGEANAQQAGADTFRMKSAAAKATQLRNIVRQPGGFDEDQFVGLVEGIKQDAPEFKNIDLRAADDKIYIFRNGKPDGELTLDQFDQLLAPAIENPGEAIRGSLKAQADHIASIKEAQKRKDDKVFDWKGEAIKALKAAEIPDSVSTAFINAQKAASTAGGGEGTPWEIGSEPNTYIVKSNGKKYIVKTNPPIEGKLGEAGAAHTLKVFDIADNSEVSPAVLNQLGLGQDGDLSKAFLDLSTEVAKNNMAGRMEVLKTQLQLFESMRDGDPQVSAGGQRFPYEETDKYVRNIMGKVGAVPEGDSRSKAKFLMNALVQQESGGNPNAVSPKGAFGLTQLMPATAGEPGFGVKPLQNNTPAEQMRFGEDYLTAMLDKYGGNPELALAAYNAGPAKVDEWMGGKGGGGGGGAPRALPAATAATAPLPPGTTKAAATAAAIATAPKPVKAVGGDKRDPVTGPSVRKQSTDLQTLSAEVEERQKLLEQFDNEQNVQFSRVSEGRAAGRGAPVPINMTPAVAVVRAEHVAALNKAVQELREKTAGTKASTAVLNRKTAASKLDAGANDLRNKYPTGTADIYKRLGASAGSK